MRPGLALLVLVVGCEADPLGRRDAGRMDAAALDAAIGPDVLEERLDAPSDAGAASDASDAPVLDDAWLDPGVGPMHPFGPCGCEVCPCPAAGTACDFPQGVPDEDFAGAAAYPTMHDVVNEAMVAVTGCAVGSSCEHGHGPEHAGAQPFFDEVIAELRSRGYCAGQHRTGETDEIAVARSCRGVWEGYHIAAYGSGTVAWARYPSAPCMADCQRLGGGSFRGIWWIPTSTCP